ncbi:acetolactate synthase large subunit, partial [Staphylococcus ureilyticus]
IEDIPRIVHEAFHLANTGRKGPVVIDFPKDMGVLKTDVELTKDINIPGYEVNNNPNKEDINKLIYMIKEAKKPLILAGAGINHSKS